MKDVDPIIWDGLRSGAAVNVRSTYIHSLFSRVVFQISCVSPASTNAKISGAVLAVVKRFCTGLECCDAAHSAPGAYIQLRSDIVSISIQGDLFQSTRSFGL